MQTLRQLFLASILFTFIFTSIDAILWSIFFYSSGAGLWGTLHVVWTDWVYWTWLVIAILVLYKNPWAALLLLIVTPGNISYFYKVFFLSTPQIHHDLDWYCSKIGSISALLMLIFGFIYYINLFRPKFKLAS